MSFEILRLGDHITTYLEYIHNNNKKGARRALSEFIEKFNGKATQKIIEAFRYQFTSSLRKIAFISIHEN